MREEETSTEERLREEETSTVGFVRVTVLSGAGMSAESGVATFRDAQTGLWATFNPDELASPEAWRRQPEVVWAWYLWRYHLVKAVEPNAGHKAVADWQQRAEVRVVTQNIDNLHERAGSNGWRTYTGASLNSVAPVVVRSTTASWPT